MIMRILVLFYFWATSSSRDFLGRLRANSCVDDKVVELLEHPGQKTDIILQILLSPGADAKYRCKERGVELCMDLGSDLPSTSLHCKPKLFSYIGPSEIEDDSTFVCFAYVYSVKAIEKVSMERLTKMADKDYIEVVSAIDHGIELFTAESSMEESSTCVTQSSDVPWGLGFMDTRDNNYYYEENDGEGTVAYVIDSGIDETHSEFEDRIIGHENLRNPNSQVMTDGSGHGTHVAGTIAGKTFGIAKKAQIYAINVFEGADTTDTATIIQGVERAVELATANNEKAVINMSLGGFLSFALDNACNAATGNGVLVVAAAGNYGINAYFTSPARAQQVLTVGSHQSDGSWHRISNKGGCVDILAPGSDVISARAGGGFISFDGTSMASPHAAGVALQIMSRLDISNPREVARIMMNDYTVAGAITNVPSNTPNVALQSSCTSMLASREYYSPCTQANVVLIYDEGEVILETTGADFGSDDQISESTAVRAEPSEGCGPITTDVNGQIAVIERGECFFSEKAQNAQDAGAIAVLILNRQNDRIEGMSCGGDCSDINIPVFLLNKEDAATLDETLDSDPGHVFFLGCEHNYSAVTEDTEDHTDG